MHRMITVLLTALATPLAQAGGTAAVMTGTQNTLCGGHARADKGLTIRYDLPRPDPRYPATITLSGGQSNFELRGSLASGAVIHAAMEFEVGYGDDGMEKPGNTYCIGLKDFDGDRIPELVVAQVDADHEGMTGVSVNVFRYRAAATAQRAGSDSKWVLAGKLDATDVLGAAKVQVTANALRVPRNVRGFYYEISWNRKQFVDSSNI